MRLEVERRTLRLVSPMQTSHGLLDERELLAVSITDDGVTGYGEAAPLESYDGVSIERAHAALELYGPVLERSRGMNGAELVDACRQVDDLPAALAAIDLALWDRGGRLRGKPIAALITDNPAREVPVNATISARDRTGVADERLHRDYGSGQNNGACARQALRRPGSVPPASRRPAGARATDTPPTPVRESLPSRPARPRV